MADYPMTFSAHARSSADMSSPWPISAAGGNSYCAIPPEFSGSGGAMSPEDLFALAIANCFVATFKVYASASRVTFDSISVQAELVLENSGSGPAVAGTRLLAEVAGAQDAQRTLTIMKKVARTGILLNAVSAKPAHEFVINGERFA